MTSPVRERFERWVAEREPASMLVRFRIAFASIWLAYDLFDLLLSGTARCNDWGSFILGAPRPLQLLQVGLIGAELALLLGRRVQLALALCLLLRGAGIVFYLHLNDFMYYIVTSFILLQAPWGELGARGALGPRWVRETLLFQLGWIYLATGLLKLNPQWLSGTHLYVRQMFLASALHWPYPEVFRSCIAHLPCDAILAKVGVAGELGLAALIFSRRFRALALLLALGIHGMGAFDTNVWFFGASMVAQLFFLFPGASQAQPLPSKASP